MKKHLFLLACLLGSIGASVPADAVDGYPKAVMAELAGATW